MRSRPIIALFLVFGLALLLVRPPEVIRLQERIGVAWLVENDHLIAARWAALAMRLQNDPVGITNYHALSWHRAVPKGGKARKQASLAADAAWRRTGRRGVGAAYWNLAMFHIKYGRKRTRSDRNTTGWLKLAARSGVAEARLLLDAGDGEFDRIKTLIEMGDPGAMATFASSLNRASGRAEYIAALRAAAEAGHVASMTRLGLALFQQSSSDPDIRKWFERAARAGQTTAAARLGACYDNGHDFCGGERDLALAEKWYELAVGPHILYQAPPLTVDTQFAIRIGTMARWVVKPHNISEHATEALVKVRAERAALEEPS